MFDIKPNPPHVIGFNNFSASVAGGEATLDVQMVTGMTTVGHGCSRGEPDAFATLHANCRVAGLGQNVNTTTWSFPTGDYIMNWAWAVGNNTQPPITTSISCKSWPVVCCCLYPP